MMPGLVRDIYSVATDPTPIRWKNAAQLLAGMKGLDTNWVRVEQLWRGHMLGGWFRSDLRDLGFVRRAVALTPQVCDPYLAIPFTSVTLIAFVQEYLKLKIERNGAGQRVYHEGAGCKRMEDLSAIFTSMGYGPHPNVVLVGLWRYGSAFPKPALW